MPEVRLWKWIVIDPITGRRHRLSFRMTEAQARERYGEDAQKVEGSLEGRESYQSTNFLGPLTARDIAAPSVGKAPFDRPGWIFELKYDGYRVIVRKHGADMNMLSRRGNDFLPWFPEIRSCVETLPDLVIDGELVVLDDVGHAQFEPLRRRALMRDPKNIAHAAKQTPAVFAFDLIALGGKDLRVLPLLAKRSCATC